MNELYKLFDLKEGCSIDELNSQFTKGLDFYNNNKEMRDRLIKAYVILIDNISKQNTSLKDKHEESTQNIIASINVTCSVQAYERPVNWTEIAALCRQIITQRLQQNSLTFEYNGNEQGFSLKKIGLLITNTANIIPVKYKFEVSSYDYNLYAKNIYTNEIEARWNQRKYLNGIKDALYTFNNFVQHKKLFLISEFLPFNYVKVGFVTENIINQIAEVLQEILMNQYRTNINIMSNIQEVPKNLLLQPQNNN